jgi:hypothetical protein
MQLKEGNTAPSDHGRWWRVLRKLKVPPKVRIFWWRVIKNFLPSNAELVRRHIRNESQCAACGNKSESLYHIIVECPWAKFFWAEVKKLTGGKIPAFILALFVWLIHHQPAVLFSQNKQATSNQPTVLFSENKSAPTISHQPNEHDQSLGRQICCKGQSALWRMHRFSYVVAGLCGQVAMGGSMDGMLGILQPTGAAKHVAYIVEEFMCLGRQGDRSVPKQQERWTAPEKDWVKVNTDGSFDGSLGRGAGAAVLRDHYGKVLAARASWYGPILDALVAEAVAARDGLELAAQLGLMKVILEIDSAVLVAALTSEGTDRSIIAGLCHDIQEQSSVFSSLADLCVKEVSCASPVKIWLNCLPHWLEEAAALDCNPALN